MAQVPRHSTETGDFERNRTSFVLYLDAENKSRSTVVTYCKALDQFRDFLRATGGPVNVADVRADHLRAFLVSLREQGKAPATVAQRYRSLQAFYKFLAGEGRIDASPFVNMHPPTVPVQPPPVLTPDQLRLLLKVTSGTDFDDRRDHAILALFIESGMRRGEMAGLRVDDVDLPGHMAFVTGKGDRDRWVSFGKATARILDRYVNARARHPNADSEWFWIGQRGRLSDTGVEQMVKRRGRQAGLVDPGGRVFAHPHLFRHTAAHQSLLDGMSEGDLMSNMGWRSRTMVDRYGASGKAERARAAQRQHSLMDRLGDAK